MVDNFVNDCQELHKDSCFLETIGLDYDLIFCLRKSKLDGENMNEITSKTVVLSVFRIKSYML